MELRLADPKVVASLKYNAGVQAAARITPKCHSAELFAERSPHALQYLKESWLFRRLVIIQHLKILPYA
jgi:hypothetical protein